MKVTFTFDGDSLHLRLHVDGNTEQAMAHLIEKLTAAKVSVAYQQYGYARSDTIQAVDIVLREPEPEPVVTGAPCSDCKDRLFCEQASLCAYRQRT